MLSSLPELIYQRGERRVYYQAKKFTTEKEVTVKLISPNMQNSLITLEELGNGLYYFDFDFRMLGDHTGTFFENGEITGSSIFRIAL